MAIKKLSDGTFKVNVTRKSKSDLRIKVQKQRIVSGSIADARKAEQQLREIAIRELCEKENRGESWGQLVADFEMALRNCTGRSRTVVPTTVKDYIGNLHLYTRDWFDRPAREITAGDVRRLYEEMEKLGKARKTKENVRSAIRQAFIWAIENRRILGIFHPPTEGVQITSGRYEEKEPEILKLDEIRKLLGLAYECKHPWAPIWEAALLTGMRSGELYALTWDDVDLDGKIITVSKSFNNREDTVGSTKGGYARRVPINDRLAQIFKDLRAQDPKRKECFPRFADWTRGEQARILRTFCEGVGLPSIKFHTLRACWATQLLREKVAPITVMSMGGWKSLKTMQIYVRRAGIEIEGGTDCLKFFDPREAGNRVVALFQVQPR